MRYYRLHGLTVGSDLELGVPSGTARPPPAAGVDLIFEQGPSRPVPAAPPPGRVVATSPDPDPSTSAALTESDSGMTLRFFGNCEFAFMPDGRVNWHHDPRVSADGAVARIPTSVVSTALVMQGRVVLHASAVELAGEAVAFAGHSGSGKSTMAAIFCASGARLVSDDLLRVDGGRCATGPTALRLRPGAAEWAEGRGADPTSRTVDDRLAVQYQTCPDDELPLAAVVLPRPSREAAAVTVERVPGATAALALSWFLRSRSWSSKPDPAAELDRLAETATQVPVWRCRLPWGPPFSDGLVVDVLEQIGCGELAQA